MKEIFNYTFNTNEAEDGVYIFNDKVLPKVYNFGIWPYMDEPSTEYGEGRCVLWNNFLASAVTSNVNFQKKDIDRSETYILNVKLKVLKPLNDNVFVGFFRSSGAFNVLNDGPLKGIGPFTKLGKPNAVDIDSQIKCIEFPCYEATDEFVEVRVSANGDKILESMFGDLDKSNVYVGIMNFSHRNEPVENYIAISEISVSKKPSNLFFEKISFYNNNDNNLSIAINFNHKQKGSQIYIESQKFTVTGFTISVCNTMPLQFEIIKSNNGSTVIIHGFNQSNIYEEINIVPVLLGVLENGENYAIYGGNINFHLSDIYRRYIEEKQKIPQKIASFFKPLSRAKISLFNNKPSNPEFLGFGALYYPWIYLKDKDGRNYTEEQAEKELDYLRLSGVRVVRVTLFVSSDWYDFETDLWKIEGTRFEAILKSLKGISARGIDVLLNFEWGNSINYSNNVFADPKLTVFDFDKQCEMLGTFVKEFLNVLEKESLKNVKYITFFSEPGSGYKDGFDNEKGIALLSRYKRCIGAVHETLVQAGTREKYKFVLGNTALETEMWNTTWHLFAPLYEVIKEFGDEWGYHNYNKYNGSVVTNTALNYENMMAYINDDIFNKTGVKANDVWIDEYNATDRNNSYYTHRNSSGWNAVHAIAGMVANMNIGYKTVLHWTFTNTLWVGSHATADDNWVDGFHCWGMLPNVMQEEEPYNIFYAYQIVASHINKGKTYIGENFSESGLCCSACENDDGTFTVIVVNSNVLDQKFVLSFEKELDNLKFDRYIFEASKNYRNKKMNVITSDKRISNVTKSIKDTIPGGSVAVYTTKRKQEQ